jgi:hypothetical protein
LTGDQLTIVTSSDLIRDIRVYDATGRMVGRASNIMDRFTQFSAASLANGMYTLHVELANGDVQRTNFIK